MSRTVTQVTLTDEVAAAVDRLSNTGRWGPDDELGTLNHITAGDRVAAATSVTSGRVVSCARPLPDPATVFAEQRLLRHVLRSGTEASAEGYSFAEEWIGMHIHGHDVTHLDALSHVFWKQRMYNDRPASEVSALSGAASLGVAAVVRETVGRGVLLDLANPDALQPGAEIKAADLDACEAREHLTVGKGDIVFVRTGRDLRTQGGRVMDPTHEGSPGFAIECADWFADREIAVLGTDVAGEARAPGQARFPAWHVVTLVAMGLWLIDNLALDDLHQACREEDRWHFLMVFPVLPLRAATGSPINPLAIF
jgi:kynurenine formamidase